MCVILDQTTQFWFSDDFFSRLSHLMLFLSHLPGLVSVVFPSETLPIMHCCSQKPLSVAYQFVFISFTSLSSFVSPFLSVVFTLVLLKCLSLSDERASSDMEQR